MSMSNLHQRRSLAAKVMSLMTTLSCHTHTHIILNRWLTERETERRTKKSKKESTNPGCQDTHFCQTKIRKEMEKTALCLANE